MSWCDLDLTLDLAIVTLTYKILSGLCFNILFGPLNSVKCRRLTLVRGVSVHHGVTFSFGSAKVCSSAIFETYFSYDKDI